MNLYGLDWAAMAFSLSALYLIGRKKPAGFLCFVTANLCWIAVGWLTSSVAISCGNVLFLVLNVRGYHGWTNARQTQLPISPGWAANNHNTR
jgi:hypothetical protein